MPIYLLPLLAPAVLTIGAAIGFLNPGRRPRFLLMLAEAAAVAAILFALISTVLFILQGLGGSSLLGQAGIGFSIRLDAVSASMLLPVSFIGWVVVRYAATYLDGEAQQSAFMGWLCLPRQLVDNGWLHLFAPADGGTTVLRYRGASGWEAMAAGQREASTEHNPA